MTRWLYAAHTLGILHSTRGHFVWLVEQVHVHR